MELLKKPPKSFSPLAPFYARGHVLPIGQKTYIVGILNLTPDSFSDGGKYLAPQEALKHLSFLEASGADLIDVGGVSARPGAPPVSLEEELGRVTPVLEAWKDRKQKALLSIDTSRAKVAAFALEKGVSIVNDVTALRGDPEMKEVIAHFQAGLILMHMKGTPQTMQKDPVYEDVVSEINRFFAGHPDWP